MKHFSIISILVMLFALASFFSATFAQDQWRVPSISTKPPTEFNYIPKEPGHYSTADWAEIIDSTWGPGLPTNTKLQLFDAAWNRLNAEYAAYQNLNIDWQALYDLYHPEVAAGVSRGRFAAIMNYMGLALQETHTWVEDKLVNQETPLDPGVPLLVVGAYMNNTHFGASLTPMPDSSLLVIRAVPNHPLGLVPGDIVLGYDGIPWKILYKELLAAQLPIHKAYMWGSTEAAMTHNLLMSAGMNWHLFDTLDVVKYSTGDTLHFSTASLAGQTEWIWGNEQLDIPGVPWPDIGGENYFSTMDVFDLEDFISWGIIDGTQIGYIYTIGWLSPNHIPGSSVARQFYDAIDTLMNFYNTTGIIIDGRINLGGDYTAKDGLSLLFNSYIETFAFDKRCGDPNNHFQMCPSTWPPEMVPYNAIYGDPRNIYDKPIAILTGPCAVSAGDQTPLRLQFHPMVKVFGKSTAGAFSAFNFWDLNGNPDWQIAITNRNLYMVDNPGVYLCHTPLQVNEEVWLTQEDVANGEDTVVRAAIAWINSMIHAHNVKAYPTFIRPGIDTLNITANVKDPPNHNLQVAAIMDIVDSINVDSLPMFDDGNHGDSLAGDGLYGTFVDPVSSENTFKINVSVTDLDSSHYHILTNAARFTAVGPVKVDHHEIPGGNQTSFSLKLFLRNDGTNATAMNIAAEVSTSDTNVTNIKFNNRDFGNIGPGQIKSAANYLIETQSNPDTVDFVINILSEGWRFWSDSITVELPVGISDNETNIPLEYALAQNYPNPFNPATNIEFSIPKTEFVTLKVYNILGEEVATLVSERLAAGSYKYDWPARSSGGDAGSLASGVYFYKIKAGAFQQIRKMVLIK